MFGSTVQAQTVVLAVFMGGCAGNRCSARARTLAAAARLYGYIECASVSTPFSSIRFTSLRT